MVVIIVSLTIQMHPAIYIDRRCQDYILIDRGVAGTTEICGNTTSKESEGELEYGKFTVFFRSSERLRFRGFEMQIVCFRPDERDLPGDQNSSCYITQ